MTCPKVLDQAVAYIDLLREEAIRAMVIQDGDRVTALFEELDVASVIVRTLQDTKTNSGAEWLARLKTS